MIKIQIKNRFTGSIIFEYSKENNTIKDTIEQAVKEKANLDGANLDGANLVRANLDGANLDGANLCGAIKLPILCKWTHGITENKIHIGCEKRSVKDWDLFFESNEELTTNRGTNEFKQIQAVFEAYKAYLNFLK